MNSLREVSGMASKRYRIEYLPFGDTAKSLWGTEATYTEAVKCAESLLRTASLFLRVSVTDSVTGEVVLDAAKE